MPGIEALESNSCPACGAKANWSPAKQSLICPYCGTVVPCELDRDTGKVQEIPLAGALRDLSEDDRGWQTEKISVQCSSCHAVMVFDPDRVGRNCDFCGSPALVPYAELKSPIRPRSLLPFKVGKTEIRESIRQWYAGRWFAPNALTSKGLVDTLKGYYIPYWTFDARVNARWRADAGHYYYETQTYYEGGRRRTRQVRRVRWVPAHGSLEHFFDDEPVPGTRGLRPKLLRKIEPFPTNELIPYDKAYLAGFVIEHYQVVLLDAAQRARAAMDKQLHQICVNRIPGDTYRNLRIDADYSGETFKHILVPVWLLTYQYSGKPYQVLVNGYTGNMAGEYPKSVVKILLLVLFVILVIALIALLANR